MTILVFVYELENMMIYEFFFMNVYFSDGILWAAWEVNHYLKKLIIWDIDGIIKSKESGSIVKKWPPIWPLGQSEPLRVTRAGDGQVTRAPPVL